MVARLFKGVGVKILRKGREGLKVLFLLWIAPLSLCAYVF